MRVSHIIKGALFAGVCWVFLEESFAQSSAPSKKPPSKPALPVLVAEQVTVELVNALLLFDRLFTQSPTVTSPDYMARVSEPSSKFYRDYVEYKAGRIRREELVDRLPHVVMLGDSLSQNFYISSLPSMFWRARTERRKNWFLDTDSAPESILSLYERLNKLTPLVSREYSGDGALVASKYAAENFPRRLVRTQNLSGQANLVLRNKRFPDLIMIWIGHNNSDWARKVSPAERGRPQTRMQELATQFREDYTQAIRPLIDRAKSENHKVALVVFGLADFETFFRCRHQAEALHRRDPDIYPYYDVTCQRFESFKPPYQKDTTRFTLMLNAELRKMVANFNRELKDYPNVRLQYSGAFSNIRIRLEILHPKDAWHLSRTGHKVIAQTAFTAVTPSLQFLGIESGGGASTRSQRAQHSAR